MSGPTLEQQATAALERIRRYPAALAPTADELHVYLAQLVKEGVVRQPTVCAPRLLGHPPGGAFELGYFLK